MPDLSAAYEAAAKALPLAGASRAQRLSEATKAIDAAYPHLLAAFKERLLSDEPVEAVASLHMPLGETHSPFVWNRIKDRARHDLEAALASLDSHGGAD